VTPSRPWFAEYDGLYRHGIPESWWPTSWCQLVGVGACDTGSGDHLCDRVRRHRAAHHCPLCNLEWS